MCHQDRSAGISSDGTFASACNGRTNAAFAAGHYQLEIFEREHLVRDYGVLDIFAECCIAIRSVFCALGRSLYRPVRFCIAMLIQLKVAACVLKTIL